MFKKLKDKIAEEVKSSPQRIQQLTQSVTEKIHTATSEDSFFSIGEDDAPSSNATPELGFSNVSLSNYSTPQSSRVRKNSNSSVASDMSFLPRYESATNLYHLQSDLDISASELEDNASSSSQLGHLTKEQIYAAFQKAQARYHKYRGRYTDIANHYRELERENTKMKSVLVETQDKALRRVAELREQCSLEQKAKAHLENALRLEIDEKQYIIDTLKTKVDLLQSKSSEEKPETLVNIEEATLNLETLTKDLKDAQTEIESLNERLQEHKANAIVFNSKESDFKNRIRDLDELNKQKAIELADVLERERENNLIIAQTKMELHTEIQNRDLEIENLKHDVEILKVDLDQYESKNKSTKLENLQSQNTKLIEKIEELSQKCKGYDSELLKLEQLKIEHRNKIEEKVTEMKELEEKHRKDIAEHRDSTKQHLLTLEAKIRETIQDEFHLKEEQLRYDYESKLQQLAANTNNFQEIQIQLLQKEDEVKSLSTEVEQLKDSVRAVKEKHGELETNHLELISENSENMQKLKGAMKECEEAEGKLSKQNTEKCKLEEELDVVRSKLENLQLNCGQLESELKDAQTAKAENDRLQAEIANVQGEIEKNFHDKLELEERVKDLGEKLQQRHDSDNNVKEELTKTKQAFQKRLKEQKTKFHDEIQSLNCEMLTFKEKNTVIQTYIDEYKEKLNEYETASAHNSAQLHELTVRNEDLQKQLQAETESLSRSLTEKEDLQKENADLQQRLHQIDSVHKEKISMLETYEAEYKKERVKLVDETATLITSNDKLQASMEASESENTKLVKEKLNLEQEIAALRSNLQNEHEQMRAVSVSHKQQLEEVAEGNRRLMDEKDLVRQRLQEEIAQLQQRNNELMTDYNHITEENENLLRDVAAINLKYEQLSADNDKWESLRSENAKLHDDLSQIASQLGETQDVEQFVNDNKKLKATLRSFEDKCITYENENKALERQVRELEHQYSELVHERQLLQDEVQELKISPININNNGTVEGAEPHDLPDNFKSLQDEHEKEINHLNEKIIQYKSLDLTNRTSIQFYENELQKLKNKNEKLNRKLDETLVTLNHCTELTTSTETEYLRNVLYNYMLGKEGLVLARVIAAVCKFDDNQTEAILQHEQQKQTLLGQLGFR